MERGTLNYVYFIVFEAGSVMDLMMCEICESRPQSAHDISELLEILECTHNLFGMAIATI